MSDSTTRGRFRYCTERGKWVPIEKPKVLAVDAPAVHTDEIPGGMLSHVDCKIYTSKSAYRRSLKELGYIEVGHEKIVPKKREPSEEYRAQLREDLERSFYELRDNQCDMPEVDRERAKLIKKQLQDYNYDRRERDQYGNLIE